MDVTNWLDSFSTERPDLKSAIDTIKDKMDASKNIETIADDQMIELNRIETELKKQFN
jgi:hypothetical protein